MLEAEVEADRRVAESAIFTFAERQASEQPAVCAEVEDRVAR